MNRTNELLALGRRAAARAVGAGAEAAEVLVSDGADDVNVQSYVDAANGTLLDRENLIDYATDNPAWKAFRALSTDERAGGSWRAV